jgi:hypothetical protein
VHCSTGDPTTSTRASAAASLGCGGGGWHLASYGDFFNPAVLLMFKPALRPFDTHRSYRAKKSAVAAVEVTAVVAGGGGLDDVPFQTTSAQEGESKTGVHCNTSCCRLCEDPAGAPALTTLPVSGRLEPRGARLGVAGKTAVASSTASPLSAREGARWRGVRRGIAGNVDRPSGSALQLPSPPGGEGKMTAAGLGVGPLSGRGGLLTTGVSSELQYHILAETGTPLKHFFPEVVKLLIIFIRYCHTGKNCGNSHIAIQV